MCVKVSHKMWVKLNSDVWQDLKLGDRYRGKRSHRFDQCLIWSLECQFRERSKNIREYEFLTERQDSTIE